MKTIKQLDEKRYYDVISFLNDYHDSIRNVASVVRIGGRICYVVGNRTVKGVQIPLDYFTVEMFEKYGFKHEQTIVRSIPNKRMPSKTSPTNKPGAKVATMSNEFIVIMTKKNDVDIIQYKSFEPVQLSIFEPNAIYLSKDNKVLIGTCRKSTRQWIKANLMYNYPIVEEELNRRPELLKVKNVLVKYRKSIVGYFSVKNIKVVNKQELKKLNYPVKSSRHKAETKYILYEMTICDEEIPALNINDITQILGKGLILD